VHVQITPRVRGILIALLISSPAAAVTLAVQSADAWRVSTGTVIVNCPLTVGGSFDAKTSGIEGQLTSSATAPTALTGELSVDLSTLDTGIGLRNRHMRERYLEIGKGDGFGKAVLKAVTLEQSPLTFSGTTKFTGELTVHGVTRPVAGEARLQPAGNGARVQAAFPVHLPDYQIAKPRYLGVGVKDDVQVKVTFEATRDAGAR